MAKSPNQKLKLLYLYQILLQRTDEEHPITVPQLIGELDLRGIRAERKSVYDDLEALRLFGLDVQAGAAHILKEFGVKLVFVTCGPEGCWFDNGTARGMTPSLRDIKVLDTTGAGDIFGGSAVWKLLQTDKAPEDLDEAELREIVSFACRAAGLSTMKHGGISSVPDSIS